MIAPTHLYKDGGAACGIYIHGKGVKLAQAPEFKAATNKCRRCAAYVKRRLVVVVKSC